MFTIVSCVLLVMMIWYSIYYAIAYILGYNCKILHLWYYSARRFKSNPIKHDIIIHFYESQSLVIAYTFRLIKFYTDYI